MIKFGKLMQDYFQLKQLVLWETQEHMSIFALLRAVISEDGMTADYFNFPKKFYR